MKITMTRWWVWVALYGLDAPGSWKIVVTLQIPRGQASVEMMRDRTDPDSESHGGPEESAEG